MFFGDVDFCPSVSEYHDKLADLHHLMKVQEGVERRLEDRSDEISMRIKISRKYLTVRFAIWS